MSNFPSQSFPLLAPLVLATTLAMLGGCSKTDEYNAAPAPDPAVQAQAVQSSISSAQAAQDHRAAGMKRDDSAEAPGMAMAAPGGGNPPTNMAPAGGGSPPMAMGAPGGDSPPTNMAAPAGDATMPMTPPMSGAPMGMTRMLGQPPMAGSSSAPGGLPPARGAPHLYHLGADTFFLDQASTIGLTSEQQKRLTALKESASVAYATTQRKKDQGEQDLWVLSSSETPDITKIETKIRSIERLAGQQRLDFIRTVGEAVGVLSDTQRRAVASQGASMQPGAMAPAPGASAMPMGGDAPPAGGMGMGMGMGGPKKMPMGMEGGGPMPTPTMGTGGMATAPSGGMGHM